MLLLIVLCYNQNFLPCRFRSIICPTMCARTVFSPLLNTLRPVDTNKNTMPESLLAHPVLLLLEKVDNVLCGSTEDEQEYVINTDGSPFSQQSLQLASADPRGLQIPPVSTAELGQRNRRMQESDAQVQAARREPPVRPTPYIVRIRSCSVDLTFSQHLVSSHEAKGHFSRRSHP